MQSVVLVIKLERIFFILSVKAFEIILISTFNKEMVVIFYVSFVSIYFSINVIITCFCELLNSSLFFVSVPEVIKSYLISYQKLLQNYLVSSFASRRIIVLHIFIEFRFQVSLLCKDFFDERWSINSV